MKKLFKMLIMIGIIAVSCLFPLVKKSSSNYCLDVKINLLDIYVTNPSIIFLFFISSLNYIYNAFFSNKLCAIFYLLWTL